MNIRCFVIFLSALLIYGCGADENEERATNQLNYQLTIRLNGLQKELTRINQKNTLLQKKLEKIKREGTFSYEQKLRKSLNKSVKDWIVVRGKWEVTKQTIKYVGPEDEAHPYGIILNDYQRIWQGSIEATINFKGEGGAHVVFAYHPVQKHYFTAGIGSIAEHVKNAFILTEQQNNTYKMIASFGKEDNLVKNSDYKVNALIEKNQIDLIVNDIKVISQQLPNIYSDRIGLLVYGTEPVEFKNFKVNSTDSTVLLIKRGEQK